MPAHTCPAAWKMSRRRRLLQHLETKVIGPWALAKAVAPHMRKQGGGRFIVIIGQAGKVPQANGIASTISNAAQHAFVKSLSDDLARDNILVNAVCPSRIKSPLTEALGHLYNEVYLGRSLEQQESRWGAEVPLGRWGTPDDIANAVAFLASERAGFIVGANIDVDGGHQRIDLLMATAHDRDPPRLRKSSSAAITWSRRCATSI